jgi:hypothetical protein
MLGMIGGLTDKLTLGYLHRVSQQSHWYLDLLE